MTADEHGALEKLKLVYPSALVRYDQTSDRAGTIGYLTVRRCHPPDWYVATTTPHGTQYTLITFLDRLEIRVGSRYRSAAGISAGIPAIGIS